MEFSCVSENTSANLHVEVYIQETFSDCLKMHLFIDKLDSHVRDLLKRCYIECLVTYMHACIHNVFNLILDKI